MLTIADIRRIKRQNNKNAEPEDEVDHSDHRLRMKNTYLSSTFESFSDVEKLEFILFYSINRKDTNPLAHRLLNKFGSFDRVLEAPIHDLVTVRGLGEHSAILLHLFLEVANSYGKSKLLPVIDGSTSAKEYCKNLFVGSCVEEFYVICLNSSGKVLNTIKINEGTASSVQIEARKVTQSIFACHCDTVIFCHNHPKGFSRPSDEDIAFTYNLVMSYTMTNILVLDHIIVSDEGIYSMAEDKIMETIRKEVATKYISIKKVRERFITPKNKYVIEYNK